MSKVNGSFPTGLDALLQRDARAKQYYSALPSYAQDLVHRGGERIQTQAELERYAGNILEGLSK